MPLARARTRPLALLLAALFAAGCGADHDKTALAAPSVLPSGSSPAPAAAPLEGDAELERCERQIAEATAAPSLPGTPAFDAQRIEVLGRAKGEPMLFVDEPRATADEALPAPLRAAAKELRDGPPGARVVRVIKRFGREPSSLRALLLRQGYLYAADPHDALALSSELHVGDLFDEAEVFLMRGTTVHRLSLERVRGERVYRHRGGPLDGQKAELLFGDRLAASEAELGSPLHRDARALAEQAGLDRMKVLHRGSTSLVVEARFGETWVKALVGAEGARLSLSCVAADRATRARVEAFRAADSPRREALSRLSSAVDQIVAEANRFDRPEGEKTAERDGTLRPIWLEAYKRGAQAFVFESVSYPVYDGQGRAWPPEVCVDFVLDSYERASGTWFSSRPEPPSRIRGPLDFDALGIKNRRGVLAFEAWASKAPELFESRRFEGEERVPFQYRSRFFGFLLEHADELRPGDVLAIQGRKRDGLIHQHAILLERTDPLTGFAYGLADQMKRPRRRTWEGIMAEAPLRSLLYRVRPREAVMLAGTTPRSAPDR